MSRTRLLASTAGPWTNWENVAWRAQIWCLPSLVNCKRSRYGDALLVQHGKWGKPRLSNARSARARAYMQPPHGVVHLPRRVVVAWRWWLEELFSALFGCNSSLH